MLYEVITYDIKYGATPEFEWRYAQAYERRRQHSELGAFWHSEIGPLNQIVVVWPYADLGERKRVLASAEVDSHWPPAINEFVLGMRSDIVTPAPFTPMLKSGKFGPFFEMRTYTLPPGEIPLAIENWEKAVPMRNQFKPVYAVWYTDIGALNKWVHIWSYESLNERMEIRDKARGDGNWPPATLAKKEGRKPYTILAQDNKILMPSAFSPVQ